MAHGPTKVLRRRAFRHAHPGLRSLYCVTTSFENNVENVCRSCYDGQVTRWQADRESYVRFTASRCPRGVYVALAGSLCDAMAAKLARELPGLLRTPELFSHTLNETISFEKELRQSLEVRR